jgi:spore coat protein U-like protein
MSIRSWMSWSVIAAIAALMALAPTGAAFAGSTTGTLPVTATISNSCTFGTISPLAFGAYDPAVANASGGTDLAASTTFAMTCTNGAAISINLDNGLHASGGSRFMASGANNLQYAVYQDPSHTTVWDNLTAENTTGTGSSQSISVYGVIPKGQSEPNGSYSDTVTITLTY